MKGLSVDNAPDQHGGGPCWSVVPESLASAPEIYLCASTPEPRDRLEQLFQANGYRVRNLDDRKFKGEARPEARQALIVLVVADPELNSTALIKSLSMIYACPMLVVHASNEARVRVDALNAGACDCISEPAHNEEIVARATAILRRGSLLGGGPLDGESSPEDGLTVRLGARSLIVQYHDRTATIALTEKEVHILGTLLNAEGEPVTRQTLSERFFLSKGDRSVDVHICNIRSKLRRAGAEGIELLGVRGVGYCLRVPGKGV